MLPQPAVARQDTRPPDAGGAPPVIDIGVGIDTARYGHYAAFLNDELQPAAGELEVVESAAGYTRLRDRLTRLVAKHGRVRFYVRGDVAGAYADNVLAWLHELKIDNATLSISCGDPQRNKNYRAAIYGPKKSDPIEARACARYAVSERPKPM